MANLGGVTTGHDVGTEKHVSNSSLNFGITVLIAFSSLPPRKYYSKSPALFFWRRPPPLLPLVTGSAPIGAIAISSGTGGGAVNLVQHRRAPSIAPAKILKHMTSPPTATRTATATPSQSPLAIGFHGSFRRTATKAQSNMENNRPNRKRPPILGASLVSLRFRLALRTLAGIVRSFAQMDDAPPTAPWRAPRIVGMRCGRSSRPWS